MNQLAKIEPGEAELISPVMNIEQAQIRLKQFREFVSSYLQENEDYGVIPGTARPTLLQPGAQKLAELYGLSINFEEQRSVIDWDKGLFDYEIKCVLTRRSTGAFIAAGLGSCSSFESRYRWRDAKRACPNCGKPAIHKSKPEKGGGWYCNGREGGCWAKFPAEDKRITEQPVGRVLNPDLVDQKNTVLKMACKRALTSGVIAATRSSGIFTQDMEDLSHEEKQEKPSQPPEETQPSQPEPEPNEPAEHAKSDSKTLAKEFLLLLNHECFTQKQREEGLQKAEKFKDRVFSLQKLIKHAQLAIAEFEEKKNPTPPEPMPEFVPEDPSNPYETEYGKGTPTSFGTRTGD